MKHTLRELTYVLSQSKNQQYVIIENKGERIATILKTKNSDPQANAKLIAKAPQMEALLLLLQSKCKNGFLEISEGDEAYDELQNLMK